MAATNSTVALARRALTLAIFTAAPSATAQEWPEVTLVTMGPGDDVFSRFGHATLCVRDGRDPRGRCYNYGTAEFLSPVSFAWEVVRGTKRFWVSVASRDTMMMLYADAEDRAVWQQRLDLPLAAREALAGRLAWDALPEHRDYVYHHFRDNCSTRLRDHVDTAYGGALRRGSVARYRRAEAATWRSQVEDGFATSPALLVGSELFLGRALDRGMTEWEAMFLPRVLRESVRDRLGVAVETQSVRTRPLPPEGSGTRGLWTAVGVLASAVALLGADPRRARHRRAYRAVVGLGLGLTATAVWALAVVGGIPELRHNELMLALWPTDLGLGAMRDRDAALYARVRVVVVAVVVALRATGALRQPLVWPCAVAGVLLLSAAFSARAPGTASG